MHDAGPALILFEGRGTASAVFGNTVIGAGKDLDLIARPGAPLRKRNVEIDRFPRTGGDDHVDDAFLRPDIRFHAEAARLGRLRAESNGESDRVAAFSRCRSDDFADFPHVSRENRCVFLFASDGKIAIEAHEIDFKPFRVVTLEDLRDEIEHAFADGFERIVESVIPSLWLQAVFRMFVPEGRDIRALGFVPAVDIVHADRDPGLYPLHATTVDPHLVGVDAAFVERLHGANVTEVVALRLIERFPEGLECFRREVGALGVEIHHEMRHVSACDFIDITLEPLLRESEFRTHQWYIFIAFPAFHV